jgi:hypothetical protein
MATRKRNPSASRRGNRRVPIELTIEREARAWELHKEGYAQAVIAQMLSAEDPKHPIGQQAVSKALRRVQESLVSDLTDKVDRYKVSQIGRLEGIFLQAMTSFRTSKGQKKKARRNSVAGDGKGKGGRVTEIVESITNDPGDPRWLEKAMEALRDQRKILGIDAPMKFDGTVKSDRPLEDLTDDELMTELAQLQDRIKKQVNERTQKDSTKKRKRS